MSRLSTFLPPPARTLLLGFAVLLGFTVAGFAIARAFSLTIPPPLLGMGLLALALRLRWLPLAWVEPAAAFLLGHMSLFFLPILFGAGAALTLAEGARLPIAVAVVIGTALTLLSTYAIVRFWPAKNTRAS